MRIFDSWTSDEFTKRLSILRPSEKIDVEHELRKILMLERPISSDALSARLIAKSRYVADVRGARDPYVLEQVASRNVKLSRQSYIYEAQFSGLPGMFLGDTQEWLSHIISWIAFGSEDFVCFGDDFRSVIVLSHSYDLRIGDLADQAYSDPEMLTLSKRLENEGQMRASIEKRLEKRR